MVGGAGMSGSLGASALLSFVATTRNGLLEVRGPGEDGEGKYSQKTLQMFKVSKGPSVA